jgi:WhiB family redox-sensing transcriptional regulator
MMGMDQFPDLPDAACRAEGVDVAWFFPSLNDKADRAKAVCDTCPHRKACGQWAVQAGSRVVGVWGGLTDAERRRLRVSLGRGRQAAAPRRPQVVTHGRAVGDSPSQRPAQTSGRWG